MKRRSMALWEGALKEGKGLISTESGSLENIAYTCAMRFEDKKGTNPEELIGAAYAACYSMALSHALDKEGFKPEKIMTNATVDFSKSSDGWSVTGIELDVTVRAPGIDTSRFESIAQDCKNNCLVSRLLKAPTQLHSHMELSMEDKKAG